MSPSAMSPRAVDASPTRGTERQHPCAEQHFQPDDAATECPLCHDEFTLLTRRHHCRWCGGVACAKCTESRHRLREESSKKQRVCSKCDTAAAAFERDLREPGDDAHDDGNDSDSEVEAPRGTVDRPAAFPFAERPRVNAPKSDSTGQLHHEAEGRFEPVSTEKSAPLPFGQHRSSKAPISQQPQEKNLASEAPKSTTIGYSQPTELRAPEEPASKDFESPEVASKSHTSQTSQKAAPQPIAQPAPFKSGTKAAFKDEADKNDPNPTPTREPVAGVRFANPPDNGYESIPAERDLAAPSHSRQLNRSQKSPLVAVQPALEDEDTIKDHDSQKDIVASDSVSKRTSESATSGFKSKSAEVETTSQGFAGAGIASKDRSGDLSLSYHEDSEHPCKACELTREVRGGIAKDPKSFAAACTFGALLLALGQVWLIAGWVAWGVISIRRRQNNRNVEADAEDQVDKASPNQGAFDRFLSGSVCLGLLFVATVLANLRDLRTVSRLRGGLAALTLVPLAWMFGWYPAALLFGTCAFSAGTYHVRNELRRVE